MKLGELFIDLGVNSGGAFNTLSGFAFKLTNIIDLAERANAWVDKAFGGQARWANDILNYSQALNISTKSLQGLRIAAMEMGTPFDQMANKLKKLDEEWLQALQGQNTQGFIKKMSWFGLTDTDVKNAKNSLEIMQKMIQRTTRMSDARIREAFRRTYGFDEKETKAWLNYFRERQKYEEHSNVLSDEELRKQNELYFSINKLRIATDTMWNRIEVGKADLFKGWVEWLERAENKFAELVTEAESFKDIFLGLPRVFSDNAETIKVWEERLNKVYGWLNKIGAFVNGAGAFGMILYSELMSGAGFKQAFKNAKEGYSYARDISLGKEADLLEESNSVSKKSQETLQRIYDKISDKALLGEEKPSVMTGNKSVSDWIRSYTDPEIKFYNDDEYDQEGALEDYRIMNKGVGDTIINNDIDVIMNTTDSLSKTVVKEGVEEGLNEALSEAN